MSSGYLIPFDAEMKLLARYGAWVSLSLSMDWLHTRLFFAEARLVRRPVCIRGRSSIPLGHGLKTDIGLRIDAFPPADGLQPSLETGDNFEINDYVPIGVVIGANAVVKGVIPPDSVAVVAPARLVKRFDAGQERWVRVT